MTSFLLAAGGTGGHMFPALATAEKLREEGHSTHIITDNRGAQYLSKAEPHTAINLSTLGRRAWWKMPVIVWQLIVLSLYCLFYFVRNRPQKVIGFGGYVSYPVLLLAKAFGVPYYLHEQNTIMGKVNRWFADDAKYIMSSFPETIPEHSNTVFSGLPVRKELHVLRDIPYVKPSNDLRVLVIGGSQGASIFSSVIPDALALLSKKIDLPIHVVQQCRSSEASSVEEKYKTSGISCHIAPFFENMAMEFKQSHVVICRAGASTIAELTLIGRPAILVPYKDAMDDHQTSNGRYISDHHAGWLMSETEFKSETLAKLLEDLLQKPDLLLEASSAMKQLGQPAATDHICQKVTR